MSDERWTSRSRPLVVGAVVVGAISLVGLGVASTTPTEEPTEGFVELDRTDGGGVGSASSTSAPPVEASGGPGTTDASAGDPPAGPVAAVCGDIGEIDTTADASRRVVLNELHYHPAGGGPDAEFIELYNASTEAVDLGGWSIAGIGHCFDDEASIGAGTTLVVTASEFPGRLDDRGETVALVDASGSLVDLVTYDDRDAWPARADGHGDSLHRIDAGVSGDRPGNWIASAPDPGRTTQYRYGQLASWSNVAHTSEPEPGEPVEISADVSGVDSVRAELAYRVGFAPETTMSMTVDADGRARATIPGQPAGTLIRYRLIGHAPDGGAGTWPRQGDGATYSGTVVQSPGDDGDLLRIRWFMPDVEYRKAFDDISLTSTRTYPAVFAIEGEVFDGATVRVKGQSSRGFPKPKWTVELPPGHRLRVPGVIDSAVDEFDLHAAFNDKSAIREILAHEAFASAGLPVADALPVRLDRNGEFEGLYTYVERADGRWRDRFGLGDVVYEVGNRAPALFVAEEAELPQPQFRLRYDREGNEWDDDDELRRFLKDLASVSGDDVDPSARRAWLFEHVDVPSIINTLAVSALIQHWDFRTKNFRLAHVDDRWTMVPFDLELTWGRTLDPSCEPFCESVAVTGPFVNDSNALVQPFSADPVLADMLRLRIDTLAPRVLDPEQAGARVDDLIDRMTDAGELDRERWGTYGAEQTIAAAADELLTGFIEPQWERLRGDDAPFGLETVPDASSDTLEWRADADLVVVTNTGAVTVDASGLDVRAGAGTVAEGVVMPPGASVLLDEGRVVEWRLAEAG